MAIDNHESMFELNEETGNASFGDCFVAAHEIADALIMSSHGQSDYKQIAVCVPNDNDEVLVKFNDDLIKSSNLLNDLSKKLPTELKDEHCRKGEFDMGLFLLSCKKLFDSLKERDCHKILIYIVNNDDPACSDPNKKYTIINEGKNLKTAGINFELVFMNDHFDLNKFYGEFFNACELDPHISICVDSDGLCKKLKSLIIQPLLKQKVNFYLHEKETERYMKCQKLFIYQQARILNNATISNDNHLVIEQKETPNGEEIETFEASPRKLEFTEQEKNLINCNTDVAVGYTLKCVTDRLMNRALVLGKPSFLMAQDDEAHQSSTGYNIFQQFWQFCVDNDKNLMCVYKRTNNSKVYNVEMIPKFVNDRRLFLVKKLPFAENISMPEAAEINDNIDDVVGSAELDSIRGLIKLLEFDYDPTMFSNIQVAKKMAYVKGKLLGKEPEDEEDIKPDDQMISERLEDVINVMNETGLIWDESVKKRKQTGAASQSKRGKK